MNIKSIIGFLLVFFLSSCTVTLRTEEVPPTAEKGRAIVTPVKDAASGIVYALPKTGLRFAVTAQKVEKKRGEFYLYSERYLGLKDVILEDAEEWEIKNIALESFGSANAEEMFQIITTENSSVPMVHLSEDGVLLSVNASNLLDEDMKVVQKPTMKSNVIIPYTEEMLLANSSAKMAQEAANYIYRLRESRTALISADLDALPPDGEAYAMSLEEIDNLEAQFISLFKGKEITTCVTEIVEIVPDEIKAKEVLFRFSSFGGVVAVDDLSGSPFFMTMEMDDFKRFDNAPADSAGLFYKKPAPVDVTVLDGSTPILNQKVLMGQFGELQSLPLHMLNDEVRIQLYPATGGLKAILK